MGGPPQGRVGILPPAQRAAGLTELGGFAVWQVESDGLIPLTSALTQTRLAKRFTATREGLAAGSGLETQEVMTRTAVSAAQVGLVSRLWSVTLASVALHDWVPDLSVPQLLLSDTHCNPAPMAVADPAAGRGVRNADEATEAIAELVLHGALASITDACRMHGRTSAKVLVSNAASSLVAAARVVGRKVPEKDAYLTDVVRQVMSDHWLAEGGSYRPVETKDAAASPPRTEFARTGCCLYYRLPGHGLCPDCVLVRPGQHVAEH